MGLEKLMPSSTRHSRKVVNHFTQAYPKRVWVIVLMTDGLVLQQVPILLVLIYFSRECKDVLLLTMTLPIAVVHEKCPKHQSLYAHIHIQVMGLESQFPVTFCPDMGPQSSHSNKMIITIPDRLDEQRCHNHVFALDWRQEIASNDSVLVIKFHVSWHL